MGENSNTPSKEVNTPIVFKLKHAILFAHNENINEFNDNNYDRLLYNLVDFSEL